MKKIIILFAIAACTLAAGIMVVDAWGITSPYWDTNPLVLAPGDSREFALLLQNMVDTETVKLKATMTAGSDVARITDSDLIYQIPYGIKDVPVNILVDIPDDAKLNGKHDITITFEQIKETRGMVSITPSITKTIPVVIQSESGPVYEIEVKPSGKAFNINITTILLALAVIGIAAYLLIPKKKKRKKRRR